MSNTRFVYVLQLNGRVIGVFNGLRAAMRAVDVPKWEPATIDPPAKAWLSCEDQREFMIEEFLMGAVAV